MKRRRSKSDSPLSLFAFQDIITSVTGIFLMLTLLMAIALTTRTQMSAVAKADVVDKTELLNQLESTIAEKRKRLAILKSQLAEQREFMIESSSFTQQSAEAALEAVEEEVRLLRESIRQLNDQVATLIEQLRAASTAMENRSEDQQKLEELNRERIALEEEVTELKNSNRVFYNETDESGRQVWLVELYNEEILAARPGQDEPPKRFSGRNHERDFLRWTRGMSKTKIRFVLIVHRGTTDAFETISDKLRSDGFSIGYDLLPDDRVAIDPVRGAN